MADALLSPPVAVTMLAATSTVTALSLRALRQDTNRAKLPTMAVMSAFVFAGQMINYAIPGTGSSGHLCGGLLLTALLGPAAAFLSMVIILTIQALFFADGGLMALGANCWNMAFYGCFVGYYLIWKPLTSRPLHASDSATLRKRIPLAAILGCILSLQLGALSVVLQTTLSGITELPFRTFLCLMQPIHLAIGLIEGLISSAVLLYVYQARPELLLPDSATPSSPHRPAWQGPLAILSALTLLIGGALALVASDKPDGLEWAIQKNTGSTEIDATASPMATSAAAIQESTAFLPDYSFPSHESPAGTSASGILGSALVALTALLLGLATRLFRTRKQGARA